MKENKTIKAINGYTKFNEGYEKKGGVNTDKKHQDQQTQNLNHPKIKINTMIEI